MGCETANQLFLDPDESSYFAGTFRSVNSDAVSGSITLVISSGFYQCFTNEPFGNGAGRLEVISTSINFIDTLFFPIPALYSAPHVLSGKYNYCYDGEKLEITGNRNGHEVKYSLLKQQAKQIGVVTKV